MTEISGHNCETAIEVKKGIEDGYGVGDGDGSLELARFLDPEEACHLSAAVE